MQVIEGPGGRLVDFAGTHLLNFNSGRWLFLSLHHTLHYDHTFGILPDKHEYEKSHEWSLSGGNSWVT